jgi:Fic family protein
LNGVRSQSIDATIRIKRLLELRLIYHQQIQEERAAERLVMALDAIFAKPILTIRQMEARLNIPYRTAQRYIERFCELGILHEITGKMRNRIYRADEILNAITELIDES